MDAADFALRVSRFSERLGWNRRQCYRVLVERMAPGFGKSLHCLGACHPFLIVSTGRTGTRWLAELLNRVEGAYVVHEPVPDEQSYHVEAALHPERALPYVQNFRIREMALRIRARNPAVYGEVNSALRRHVSALRRLAPQFRILHLVRDGRDVVTSVMNRINHIHPHRLYNSMYPPGTALDTDQWRSMDRFSRVCSMWADDNSWLRRHADGLVRFEDMISRYDLFKEQILDPLGLFLDEETWAAHAAQRVNATQQGRHPGYETWTAAQKNSFWRLCEEEMAEYGYLR